MRLKGQALQSKGEVEDLEFKILALKDKLENL